MEKFESEEAELAWFVGLIEGEGSFCVQSPQAKTSPWGAAKFFLGMTDEDVLLRTRALLETWGVFVTVRTYPPKALKKNGQPEKRVYELASLKSSVVQLIIEKCYPYFSEKKQTDCDRCLKNLAERGLLGR